MEQPYHNSLLGLLPGMVSLESANRMTGVSEPTTAESALVANAVESRQREFGVARSCARRALSKLGRATSASILVGKHREPLWPDGIVGSITHCTNLCAAAVAFRSDLKGVGIDAENIKSVTPDLVPIFCVDRERDWLAKNPNVPPALLFSGKEAAFKSWFPSSQTFLDFSEVELTITGERTFRVHSESADLSTIEGAYALCRDLVVTTALRWS